MKIITFYFHTNPKTIRVLINNTTHISCWYCGRCWNQRYFEPLQISVRYSTCHVLQPWLQIVAQWIQIRTSRQPVICSYEARNIAFKPLLSCFALCAEAELAGRSNALQRVLVSCFVTPSKTFCWYTFASVVRRYNAFTRYFPPSHYSSWMVSTLKPWNTSFCVFKSFCVFLSFWLLEPSSTGKQESFLHL